MDFSRKSESISKYLKYSVFCMFVIVFTSTIILLAFGKDESFEDTNNNKKNIAVEFIDKDVMKIQKTGTNQNSLNSSNLQCSSCTAKCSIDDNENRAICENAEISAVNKFLQNKNSSRPLNLCLNQINFPKNRLDREWYNQKIEINSLTITLSYIHEIDKEAFENVSFKKLQKLELNEINVDYLHLNIFKDLNQLKDILIHNIATNFLGRNFLEANTNTLEKFIYIGTKDSKMITPKQFIGLSKYSLYFKKLIHLEFHNNNFANMIDKDTFTTTTKLKTLMLAENQIIAIGENAFKPLLLSLDYLDLSRNLLITVSENFLSDFFNEKTFFHVDLSRNFWNCDCKLKSLVENYKKFQNAMFQSKVYCSSPAEFNGYLLDAKNVCLGNCAPKNSRNHTNSENLNIWIPVGVFGGIGVGLSFMLCYVKFKTKRASKKAARVRNYSDASTQSFPILYQEIQERRKSDLSFISESYILPNFYEAIGYTPLRKIKSKISFDNLPNTSPPPLPKRQSEVLSKDLDSMSEIYIFSRNTRF